MKRTPVLMLLIAITSLLSAQEPTFKMSDYKLPELDYRTLSTRVGLRGYTNNEYSPKMDTLINQNEYDTKSSSNYGDVALSYYHYINSETLQRNVYASARLDFNNSKNNSKSEYELYERKSKSYSSFLVYDLEDRYYFKPNEFFGLNARFLYDSDNYHYYRFDDYSNSDFFYKDDDNRTSNDFSLDLEFKYGLGRIEDVKDARHAYIILDELSKASSIAKDYNNEDILELAKLISELNKERFFDNRHKQIYIYEQLDSFLVDNGYISDGDIKYFTILSDTWLYGSEQRRLDGSRLSFSVSSDINLIFSSLNQTDYRPNSYYVYDPIFDTIVRVEEQEKTKYLKEGYNEFYNLQGGIEYEYEKALSIKWQHSISSHLKGGMMLGSINSDTESDDIVVDSVDYRLKNPNLDFAFEHGIGYYPNTRTSLSCNYFVNYAQVFYPSSSDFLNIKGQGLRVGTNLSAYYYISPKMRLSANWNLSYEWQNSDEGYSVDFEGISSSIDYYASGISSNWSNIYKEKRFYNSFQLSINYAIF